MNIKLPFLALFVLLFAASCQDNQVVPDVPEMPSVILGPLPVEYDCSIALANAQNYGQVNVLRNANNNELFVTYEYTPKLNTSIQYNTEGFVSTVSSQEESYDFEYANGEISKITHSFDGTSVEVTQRYNDAGLIDRERPRGMGLAFQESVNLVVVTGQSNAGEALLDDLAPENAYITEPIPNVQMYDWRTDNRFKIVNETTPFKVGPHHQVAYRLSQEYPNQEHYLFNRAWGGASLFYQDNGFDFEPEADPTDPHSAFPQLVDNINQAVAALADMDKNVTTISLVWIHGERDAGILDNVERYNNKFISFLSALTDRTGLPFRTVVFQEVHGFLNPNTKPYVNQLSQNMVTLAANYNNWFTYDPNSSEIRSDNVHFTANGYIQNGNLAYDLMNTTYSTFSRAPEVELPRSVLYTYDANGNVIQRLDRYRNRTNEFWYYEYDDKKTPGFLGMMAIEQLPINQVGYFSIGQSTNQNNIVRISRSIGRNGPIEEISTYDYTYNVEGYPTNITQNVAATGKSTTMSIGYTCTQQ